MGIADFAVLSLIACGLLLGSMVFFAAVVAPSAFRFLPQDMSAQYLRGVFPRYYRWGEVLACLAAVAALPVDAAVAGVVAAVAAAFIAVRLLLVPKINAAREARLSGDAAATAEFSKLHRISVIINMSQMLALAGIMVFLVS